MPPLVRGVAYCHANDVTQHMDVKLMLSVFIPSSERCVSRCRYLLSFALINIIFSILVGVLLHLNFVILAILFTILLHYLVINLNCQRFRDSGFEYIKFYVWGTLVIYIASFVIMVAEDFACDGFGMPLFLIWYFATFSLLLLAPPNSNSLNK
ncbi:hypothetical protein NLN86_18780 [Citrobacter portucalensis]|uniref:Inner membrane protein yigG n=1 Tax=Citrobacter portucalensis TaxID=1639133 RepID=A0AAW5W978_9ENTR|nr:hypothetical protein [Citrobacter portucalensis]MCX9003686.1 hypothetical protein [Citrobacter portucalensis]